MEIFTKDFVEFIECCVARDVEFLIVGGYALAAHGHPRATKDLDVWVLIGEQNAERLVAALDDLGMSSVGLEPTDFLEPEMVVQLGYPPYRIDLGQPAPNLARTSSVRREHLSGLSRARGRRSTSSAPATGRHPRLSRRHAVAR